MSSDGHMWRAARNIIDLPAQTLQLRLDLLDVLVGLRPAARLVVHPEHGLELLVSRILETGLHIEVGEGSRLQSKSERMRCVDWFERTDSGERLTERMALLYVGTDASSACKCKLADQSRDDDVFGRALGYPECCREFVRRRGAVPALREVFDLYASDGFFNPWTWSGAMSVDAALLPHFPCSRDCTHSMSIAKSRWRLVSELGVAEVVTHLKRYREGCFWLSRDFEVKWGLHSGASSASALAVAVPLRESS